MFFFLFGPYFSLFETPDCTAVLFSVFVLVSQRIKGALHAFHESNILFQFLRILLPCISPPYVFRSVTKCYRFILASLMDLSKVPCFVVFLGGGGQIYGKIHVVFISNTARCLGLPHNLHQTCHDFKHTYILRKLAFT